MPSVLRVLVATAELDDFWQLCQELEVMKNVCTGTQQHANVLTLHAAVSNLDGGTRLHTDADTD